MKYIPLSTFRNAITLSLVILGLGESRGATLDLNFTNPTITPVQQTPDDLYWQFLGPYVSKEQIDNNSGQIGFTNVATLNGRGIDLMLRATAYGNASLIGHFTDYLQGPSEPNGDLGLLFQNNGYGVGGIAYEFTLYEGGTNFTRKIVADQIEIMLYDVDGETASRYGGSTQTEAIIAKKSDGITGYDTPRTPGGVTAQEAGDEVRFAGPGFNLVESDTSGAFVLRYANTSTFTLRYEANAINGSTANPAFAALDGDLSFLGNPFAAPAVPEPSTGLLASVACLLGLQRRRRSR